MRAPATDERDVGVTGSGAADGAGQPGSPPATLRVRAARPQDAAELHELSQRAITRSAATHYTAEQLSAWTATRSVEGHRRYVTEARTVVVDDCGMIAGFLTLRDGPDDATAAEVDQLFVDPRAGGRGVARLLLDAAEGLARAAAHRRISTHASWRAVPVLEACGYRRVRTETVRLGDQVLTRAFMVRDVAEHPDQAEHLEQTEHPERPEHPEPTDVT